MFAEYTVSPTESTILIVIGFALAIVGSVIVALSEQVPLCVPTLALIGNDIVPSEL